MRVVGNKNYKPPEDTGSSGSNSSQYMRYDHVKQPLSYKKLYRDIDIDTAPLLHVMTSNHAGIPTPYKKTTLKKDSILSKRAIATSRSPIDLLQMLKDRDPKHNNPPQPNQSGGSDDGGDEGSVADESDGGDGGDDDSETDISGINNNKNKNSNNNNNDDHLQIWSAARRLFMGLGPRDLLSWWIIIQSESWRRPRKISSAWS